ncbi:App1 family protein [candidate division KSB1 bacterium]|nr:App1 family protein [candidate division KSB1 bacterium]
MLSQFLSDEEQVTFYPTYGYKENAHWKIPMRVWVHEPRGIAESLITKVVAGVGDLDEKGRNNFRARIADLVADDESGETVKLMFDADGEREEFRVQKENGEFPNSDSNGLIEGFIILSEAKAGHLIRAQNSEQGWLTFRAVSTEHTGMGRVRLLAPHGLSVISDIDDTIKVTGILKGVKTIVRNTFFEDFVAVPEMAKRYRQFDAAAFHYVSGGPWQLYRPLAEFLIHGAGGFPEGSFHMKSLRKNIFSMDTWEDLQELAGGDATFEQKMEQISTIMMRFPERKFVLIGDSGEKDPEIYREIQMRFPQQVREICIRDLNRERLQGITTI